MQPPQRSQLGSQGARSKVTLLHSGQAAVGCSPAEDMCCPLQGRAGQKSACLGGAEPGGRAEPSPGLCHTDIRAGGHAGALFPETNSQTLTGGWAGLGRAGCSPRCSVSLCRVKNASPQSCTSFLSPFTPCPSANTNPAPPPQQGATREAPSCCHESALMEIKEPFTVRHPIT